MKNLLGEMLNPDQNKRITSEQALNHPWFTTTILKDKESKLTMIHLPEPECRTSMPAPVTFDIDAAAAALPTLSRIKICTSSDSSHSSEAFKTDFLNQENLTQSKEAH